jgi:hypothetical protein
MRFFRVAAAGAVLAFCAGGCGSDDLKEGMPADAQAQIGKANPEMDMMKDMKEKIPRTPGGGGGMPGVRGAGGMPGMPGGMPGAPPKQ